MLEASQTFGQEHDRFGFTKNSIWVFQQPTLALFQSAPIRRLFAAGTAWTSSRQSCLSCRRHCTFDRKGQLRAASHSGNAQELECLSPLETALYNKCSRKTYPTLSWQNTKRHGFGAPLPEVPVVTCQGWSVNSGARFP